VTRALAPAEVKKMLAALPVVPEACLRWSARR
jgi:hypothetical protein